MPGLKLPIQTERLILRAVTLDDAEAIQAYQGDPEVCRYIPFEPRDVETIRQRIRDGIVQSAQLPGEGRGLTLGVIRKDTGEFIGDVLLFNLNEEHKGADIGYAFNRAHHGNGFATEAVAELFPIAFDLLGLHRLVARTDARNTASGRVLRRLGMREEAYLRENEWFKGRWSDEIDFAILDHEWRAARA